MQSSVWAQLLRQFPPEEQKNLSIVTTAGTEIALQLILRLDLEFFVVRGRIAGSTDGGRLFFLPYDHIDYLATQQACGDAEFQALWNGVNVSPLPPSTSSPPPAAPTPIPDTIPTAEDKPAGGSGVRNVAPIKSAVLERFRARGGAGSSINLPNVRPNEG